jgi:hypothetical protein
MAVEVEEKFGVICRLFVSDYQFNFIFREMPRIKSYLLVLHSSSSLRCCPYTVPEQHKSARSRW